jgi:hypothetical protein
VGRWEEIRLRAETTQYLSLVSEPFFPFILLFFSLLPHLPSPLLLLLLVFGVKKSADEKPQLKHKEQENQQQERAFSHLAFTIDSGKIHLLSTVSCLLSEFQFARCCLYYFPRINPTTKVIKHFSTIFLSFLPQHALKKVEFKNNTPPQNNFLQIQ